MLYKLLYRKRLLVEVYKHSIYRFYLTGQFMPYNFGRFWKQSLGFVFTHIGTCMSGTQKEVLMKTIAKGLDSFKYIIDKIRFIHSKRMKVEQLYF